jgi:hypothetical protein
MVKVSCQRGPEVREKFLLEARQKLGRLGRKILRRQSYFGMKFSRWIKKSVLKLLFGAHGP